MDDSSVEVGNKPTTRGRERGFRISCRVHLAVPVHIIYLAFFLPTDGMVSLFPHSMGSRVFGMPKTFGDVPTRYRQHTIPPPPTPSRPCPLSLPRLWAHASLVLEPSRGLVISHFFLWEKCTILYAGFGFRIEVAKCWGALYLFHIRAGEEAGGHVVGRDIGPLAVGHIAEGAVCPIIVGRMVEGAV